jgi:hypothetical protein
MKLKQIIQPGDIFVMYLAGHGTTEVFGFDESPPPDYISGGDEYIYLGIPWYFDVYTITDDELTSWLSGIGDDIEKWIFLDACSAGGFWGNNNPNDQGDLEKLNNISIIAAAREGLDMHWIGEVPPAGHPWQGDFGKPLFGMALREAWDKTPEGNIKSDLGGLPNGEPDGILTFHELSSWLENTQNYYGWINGVWTNLMDGIIVREGDFGDLIIYSSDMWNPVSEKTDDFIGVLLPDSPDTPSADSGGPYSGEAGFPITFDASSSTTPNVSIVLYEWDWENDGVFDESTGSSIITHTWYQVYSGTVRLRVTDNEGLTEIDSASLDVIDTTPPVLSVSVNPAILSPPNHKMVQVSVDVSVSDNCDADPDIVLISVVCDEPDDALGVGDGHTTNDVQNAEIGTEDFALSLRAERQGKGDGRTYTMTYEATDDSGNSTTATATVIVPYDQE